jgi:hypothetical protein
MSNVTVGLLDGKCQILAVEVSIFGQKSKKAWPFIRDKDTGSDIQFIQKLF